MASKVEISRVTYKCRVCKEETKRKATEKAPFKCPYCKSAQIERV